MTAKLETCYHGLTLKNPVIAGASPLADRMDTARQLEDSGAAAIILHSLFEEQITADDMATDYHTQIHGDSFSEALSFFPENEDYAHGPQEYLEHIAKLKEALGIPVIASLNGVTPGGWTHYAELIQKAGADALELNLYQVSANPKETSMEIETRLLETVSQVSGRVSLPLAVKISPFFTAPLHFVSKLEQSGADAAVLFNRFYQPDIDVELLEAVPRLHLSDSSELLLRLRWLAALHGLCGLDLALSGGVNRSLDLVKGLMAGATTVQVVSTLLKNGPAHVGFLLRGLETWMDEHEYESVEQLRGSMSLKTCPDPAAFERGNYMRVLQGWRI
ncbi:MAG: dihydroorotate dehydrogenase-like protein [Methylacidiphilales bacterium]|nr:dihydroorotate dehydrogenase-like protein [Candidatus Methylacidiphilales bacterium]